MKKVCLRCGISISCTENQSEANRMISQLDSRQRNYIIANYRNYLCPNCVQEIEQYFYAFSINPCYNKKQSADNLPV